MGRQKREKQAHRSGLIVGRISLTRRGYGFVDAPEGDIYVSPRDTAGAMHGDTVAVRPQARRGKEGRRGSGRARHRAQDLYGGGPVRAPWRHRHRGTRRPPNPHRR